MKITVVIDGRRHEATLPHEQADHVLVQGQTCPDCGRKLRAQGVGAPDRGHDTYSSPARCADCGATFGRIEVKMSTIFGLEEDEAVLCNGRARVY